jgi:hypothetical protein
MYNASTVTICFLAVLSTEVNCLSKKYNKRDSEGKMTVQEAGKMGGQKVRRLVEEGKEHEEE